MLHTAFDTVQLHRPWNYVLVNEDGTQIYIRHEVVVVVIWTKWCLIFSMKSQKAGISFLLPRTVLFFNTEEKQNTKVGLPNLSTSSLWNKVVIMHTATSERGRDLFSRVGTIANDKRNKIRKTRCIVYLGLSSCRKQWRAMHHTHLSPLLYSLFTMK